MKHRQQGRRGKLVLAAAALLAALAGAGLLVAGFAGQHHAPQPPAGLAGSYALHPHSSTPAMPAPSRTAATSHPAPTTATPTAKPTPTVHGPILPASTPVHLDIPAIDVHTNLLHLGLKPDGTVQVPPLLAVPSQAGWYKYSPTPGQLGPAVILGHIDSAAHGPAVFFKLGALRPGETVSVTRADHTVAVFAITAVAEYPKAHFPTLTVYGNTDRAELRLITCGGKFNFSERSYESNVVVYANLVSAHPG